MDTYIHVFPTQLSQKTFTSELLNNFSPESPFKPGTDNVPESPLVGVSLLTRWVIKTCVLQTPHRTSCVKQGSLNYIFLQYKQNLYNLIAKNTLMWIKLSYSYRRILKTLIVL